LQNPSTRITLAEVCEDDWVTQEGCDPFDDEGEGEGEGADDDDDGEDFGVGIMHEDLLTDDVMAKAGVQGSWQQMGR
jgi:hypothetical protein